MVNNRSMALFPVLALLIAGVAACGSDNKSESGTTSTSEQPATGTKGETVAVRLADFSIKLDKKSVAAGKVTFEATNDGPSPHELVVYRAEPGEKPGDLKLSGSVAELDQDETLGSIGSDELPAASSSSLTVDLKPGSYILLCNLPGHYQQGMYIGLTVK